MSYDVEYLKEYIRTCEIYLQSVYEGRTLDPYTLLTALNTKYAAIVMDKSLIKQSLPTVYSDLADESAWQSSSYNC